MVVTENLRCQCSMQVLHTVFLLQGCENLKSFIFSLFIFSLIVLFLFLRFFFFFKAFKNSSSRTEAQNTLNPSVVYLVNYRYPVKQIGMASLLLALAGYASLLLSLSVLLLFIFFCCPFGLILVVPMQTLLKASFLNVTRTHNKTPIITL